jgi:MSHA biogenesis protein MshJ
MKELWRDYSAKFLTISAREQYLVLLTGLIAITFIFFNLFIDEKRVKIDSLTKQIKQANSGVQSTQTTIDILQQSLAKDPNVAIHKQIVQYEEKLASVDSELLLLTSDLINPIQMRYALIDLLKTQKSVSLLSFEVIEAQAMTTGHQDKDSSDDNVNNEDGEQSLTLYKHGIKLKLKGSYFKLRDYLSQLEKMQWTFFWQEFDYQLIEYPNSELSIEMYSLSTKKEFIGV